MGVAISETPYRERNVTGLLTCHFTGRDLCSWLIDNLSVAHLHISPRVAYYQQIIISFSYETSRHLSHVPPSLDRKASVDNRTDDI